MIVCLPLLITEQNKGITQRIVCVSGMCVSAYGCCQIVCEVVAELLAEKMHTSKHVC